MPSETEIRLSKLRRRVKTIATKEHFDKIVASFPADDQQAIRTEHEPLLSFEPAAVRAPAEDVEAAGIIPLPDRASPRSRVSVENPSRPDSPEKP